MLECNFSKWMALREQSENTSSDPFTTLQQKQGDIVYFGVHDLAKQYKQSNSLPMMSMDTIGEKKGEITDADPVDQVVSVAVTKAPFHYGYRKLEGKKEKMRRYMREDGQMEVQISVSNLIDISHLVSDSNSKVWLVIDGNTSYQKNLMREIRKKEVDRANNSPVIDYDDDQDEPQDDQDNSPSHPPTRHYDDYEGEEFSLEDDEDEEDKKEDDDDKDYMHLAHFDPTMTSKSRGWKHFNETHRYSYYPT